jgi:hypothetical protein
MDDERDPKLLEPYVNALSAQLLDHSAEGKSADG